MDCWNECVYQTAMDMGIYLAEGELDDTSNRVKELAKKMIAEDAACAIGAEEYFREMVEPLCIKAGREVGRALAAAVKECVAREKRDARRKVLDRMKEEQ